MIMNDLPVIPGYRIIKMLGQGGMADVYEAVQENLDRRVAIKVIIPDLFRDTSFSARFVKEAQTAAKLSHQHVLHIYDVGATRNCHYIVMECLQKSLKERLKQGALAPDVALRIMLTMGQALDYAHQKGFVHRDIKPDNILFREDGTPVLTDFGIVKALDSTTKLTRTGMWVGTPHYMSPEQIRGADIDGRADFYSLGIVFYEMLIGKVPYEATDPIAVCMKQMNEPLPVLPASLSRYQPLLEGLLAKDPEQRVASSGELQRLIDGLIGEFQKPSEIKKPSGPLPETDKACHTIPLKTLAYNFRDRAAAVGKNRHRLVPWLVGSLVVVMLIVVVVWNKQSNNANVGEIPPGGDKRETPLKLPETKIIQPQPEDPETIKKREQLAANEAEKQRLAAEQAKNKRIVQEEIERQAIAAKNQFLKAEATKKQREEQERQRLEEEQKAIVNKQKEAEAARLAAENMQKTQSVQSSTTDIPQKKELKRIGLFELDSQLTQEYGQKLQRIIISLAMENINAFGQISVRLNVDGAGKISINSMDTQLLMVDPPNLTMQVQALISRAFTAVELLPPRNRYGQAVILENWRLSLKVVTLAGKITLI
ncbi:MAG: serine/threonine-protein kinase, partial [Candidatus Aminicenantes bacterium]|nr:serine/threonine-protein kinase [Candidatus Aminicenantes bacterium]